MHSRRTTKRLRQKIWHSRKRKKANRSLRTVGFFFFVPIVAETLSVLKEAGDKLCVCSGRGQKVIKSISGLARNPDAEKACAPCLRSCRGPAAWPP